MRRIGNPQNLRQCDQSSATPALPVSDYAPFLGQKPIIIAPPVILAVSLHALQARKHTPGARACNDIGWQQCRCSEMVLVKLNSQPKPLAEFREVIGIREIVADCSC